MLDATVLVLVAGLAVLSIASGMLGLGVAFAAVPFLGFFLPDLDGRQGRPGPGRLTRLPAGDAALP